MRALIFVLLMGLVPEGNAQERSDQLVGKWLKVPKKDLIINVYKSGGNYIGKISWTKDPDSTNLKGFQILDGLSYDADDNLWDNGKIHHPKTSSTYRASAKIRADGTLELLAYKGFKFIGKKKYFQRVK